MGRGRWVERARKFGRPGSARQLELREQRAEAHAQLVVERSQDDNYASWVRTDDGELAISIPADLEAEMAAQVELFEQKFGRPPGPDDPILFDPNADTPQPIDEREYTNAVAAAMAQAGVDPAVIGAFVELGFFVSSENEQMFSFAEIEQWEAAVQRNRQRNSGFFRR